MLKLKNLVEGLISSISDGYTSPRQQELITEIRKVIMSGQWPDPEIKITSVHPDIPKPQSDVQWDEVKCVQRARERGDLTFTLVGQDLTSPKTICYWIMENVETCPGPKLMDALEKAIRMRDLPILKRKAAD